VRLSANFRLSVHVESSAPRERMLFPSGASRLRANPVAQVDVPIPAYVSLLIMFLSRSIPVSVAMAWVIDSVRAWPSSSVLKLKLKLFTTCTVCAGSH
jgi:hypothetical protein